MDSPIQSNECEQSSLKDTSQDDDTGTDEEMEIPYEALENLRSQIDMVRNKGHIQRSSSQIVELEDESLSSLSSDFEIGNDDVCDSDTEWSDEDVMSLGLRCKASIKRRELLPVSDSDSDTDDNVPLSTLTQKDNDHQPHNINEPVQSSDVTENACTSTTLSSISTSLDSSALSPTAILTKENATQETAFPLLVSVPLNDSSSPAIGAIASSLPGLATPLAPILTPITPDDSVSLEFSSNIRKTVSRKRTRQPAQWKQNKQKILKNTGNAYIGFKGKEVPSKRIRPGCADKCPKKCHQQFNQNERHETFSNYWKSGDINVQRQFISSCVSKIVPDRIRTKKPESRRKYTLSYSFRKSDGKKIVVCRQFFLDTLDIKQDIVYGALEKIDGGGVVSADQRGTHGSHVALTVNAVEEIKAHIRSFPTVPPHYCRQASNRMYLEEGLNISMMYRLYKEISKEKTASMTKYRQIFNTEFNLGFFSPKKDQCDQCLAYNATQNPSQEQQDNQKEHMQRKEKAREYKALVKQQAATDSTVIASCFDLQKVLQCPHGEASSFYYKRKLSVYNLTFYEMGSQDVQCFIWPEHISSRGSNQIASCLWHYIQMYAAQGKEKYYFISDNCAGQNRNRFVASMFWFCLKTMSCVKEIEHRFLEVGHTQNENDSVHSVIAHAAKRIPVYTPEQWATVVRGARRSKSAYTVKEMCAQDFFDFKMVSAKIKNLDFDEDGQKIRWTKIRAVSFNQAESDKMVIHYDEQVCSVNLMRRKRKSDEPEGGFDLSLLWEPAGVSEDKKKDLISLCSANLIPPVHHLFYRDLPVLTKE